VLRGKGEVRNYLPSYEVVYIGRDVRFGERRWRHLRIK